MPFSTIPDFGFTGTISPLSFGASFAVNGDGSQFAVGAPRHDDFSTNLDAFGAAYVYNGDTPPTPQTALILPLHEGGTLGQALAMNAAGTLLLAGIPGADFDRSDAADFDFVNNSGMAHVYDLSGGVPALVGTLHDPQNVIQFDQFGFNVDLAADGTRAVVASGIRGDGSPVPGTFTAEAGDLHIYGVSGTAFTYQYTLTPDTPTPLPYSATTGFGTATDLSADGNLLIVGAANEELRLLPDSDTLLGRGAVYIYELGAAGAVQTARITQEDAGIYARFGHDVEVSAAGDVLAVSAFQGLDPASGGRVYIYDLVEGVPTLRFSFTAEDNETGDAFGSAMDMTADGRTLVVSSPGWDGSNLDTGTGEDFNDGRVYAFDISGNTPVLIAEVAEPDGLQTPSFGSSLSISADGGRILTANAYPNPFGSTAYLVETDFLSWNRQIGSDTGDAMTATRGSATLLGLGGNDILIGGVRSSLIDGGAGNDRVVGRRSDDILVDGTGVDRLRGNGGADTFVLSADSTRDRIAYFESGIDLLDLSEWGASSVADITITNVSQNLQTLSFEDEVLVLRHGHVVEADILI